MIITLNPQEVYVASLIGMRRRLSSVSAGHKERNGASRMSEADRWFSNVVGAMGELAAAKALGVYWPPTINASKSQPDMPPNWQVRCLAEDGYDLIVRADDVDEHRYVLVTGSGPQFTVHGWILGSDAKKDCWWKDRGGRNAPCYWVPQSELNKVG